VDHPSEWPSSIRTARLLLRRWRQEDREPFAAINADPRVTEFLPTRLSRELSDAFIDRVEAHFDRLGYGLWAVEIPGITTLAGFIGLTTMPFLPAPEIGWRLGSAYWGGGYATEGARAALAFGSDVVGLDEIVSVTAVGNARSRRVMEKIGMTRDPSDDFDHPLLPEGHPLRRHVMYRIRQPARG